jgi:drug/metabolite transporter (DMT)-like permease
VTWAGFSLGLRRLGPRGQGRMPVFAAASLALALVAALATGTASPPSGRALLAAAWLGLGPMALAFACWDRALALGSASKIGALSYVDPLLSTLCVAALLGKPITAPSIAGMVLIVAGAAAATALAGRA